MQPQLKLFRRTAQLLSGPSVITIGNFDGVHLGHQKILREAVACAQKNQWVSGLLTFDPSPYAFLCPEKKVSQLTSLREKMHYLKALQLEQLWALPFNAVLASYAPQKFIEEILIKKLQAKVIFVGEDFRFGYQREGNVALLQKYDNFSTCVMGDVVHEQQRVSSTLIRQALTEGSLDTARLLLGHSFEMMGRVVKGDQRASILGFPTANIALDRRYAPVGGVFAVRIRGIDDQVFSGVANVGKRPTLDGARSFLEVFIFDFQKNIYGKHLSVEFVKKIRDEVKFASVEALKAQIQEDVECAKAQLLTCS